MLAFLLKRARDRRQPIIVTQKGYSTGVLLDMELYTALRALATAHSASQEEPAPAPAEPEVVPAIAEPEPAAAHRGGRRRKVQREA